MKNKGRLTAMFLIPSIIGVLIFMIPVVHDGSWTIIVKIFADYIKNWIGEYGLSTLSLAIITISALMSVVALAKPSFIMNNKILKNAFACSPIWVIIRLIGCAAVWITWLAVYGYIDIDIVSGNQFLTMVVSGVADGEFDWTRGMLALDLIRGLVIIFLFASFLLPLLLDFGLLEYVGALLTKAMRPIFKVPGRAAVDCITSWIGDGTLGVMLTNNQYEGGYYNAKEASIIATTFSAVSITFSLVVLDQVGLTEYFGLYYLLICFVGVVCAIVCPRLYPLRRKPETYLVEGNAMPDTLPAEYNSANAYGYDLALRRVAKHKGISEFLYNGLNNCMGMWFGVLPTVMAIGTVALILADYTPIFAWLGMPFQPLFQMMGVPEATAASETMIVGFTDMFTPAIIISGKDASGAFLVPDITRFIVAVISITQVLFLDEVGGLILSSKLPVNLWELFVIFLERTIISILIVVPIAHLIF